MAVEPEICQKLSLDRPFFVPCRTFYEELDYEKSSNKDKINTEIRKGRLFLILVPSTLKEGKMAYKKEYKYEDKKLVLKLGADVDADGKQAVELELKLDLAEVVDEVLRVAVKDPELADKVQAYVPHLEAFVHAVRLAKKA